MYTGLGPPTPEASLSGYAGGKPVCHRGRGDIPWRTVLCLPSRTATFSAPFQRQGVGYLPQEFTGISVLVQREQIRLKPEKRSSTAPEGAWFSRAQAQRCR